MAHRIRLTQRERDLIRRYLVWCYKTVKEELDRIDRYFTQLNVDDFVLKRLKKAKEYKTASGSKGYRDLVDQFQAYMKKKETDVLGKKFKGGNKQTALNPGYQYLHTRFVAIEEAICHFLGGKELNKIRLLYEQEMTKRILEARGHT